MTDGAPSGLEWEVVESLPVSEDIKKQKGDWKAHLANWKQSMIHLREAGIDGADIMENDDEKDAAKNAA